MRTDPDTGLSPAEIGDLHRIAGIMIPPDEALGMPGADDPIIFGDIVRSLGRDLGDMRDALAALATVAGGALADVDAARLDTVAKAFLAGGDPTAPALGRVVLQCYYRDDRVLQALGLEARAPFPKGHVLEQGDWSLLSVVQSRPPLWRDDRRA